MSQIISFTPALAPVFRDLNLEWLEHYFYVEAHDKELLDHCEKEIIDKGGYIFFYKDKDVILGTFALIKISDDVFELAKMAVDKRARGKGIGQIMMRYCIEFSRSNNYKKLILYSNTILDNSIHIYKKFGFEEIPIEENNPYDRGNIKMEYLIQDSLNEE